LDLPNVTFYNKLEGMAGKHLLISDHSKYEETRTYTLISYTMQLLSLYNPTDKQRNVLAGIRQ
jgi:hypothetical protein